MTAWATHLRPGCPALLHPGRGRRWTWGDSGPIVDDGERIWVYRGERVSADGVWPAPLPVPLRELDGFVYRTAETPMRSVAALRADERWLGGPRGAVLVGTQLWSRGGAPGLSPRALPCELLPEPLHWHPDGTHVVGLDPDETRVVIDLRTAEVVSSTPGVPIAWDRWLAPDGMVRSAGSAWGIGGREGSCARWEEWLAGPGGRVWSLRTGEPAAGPAGIALGATVGTPDGFVTVDWQTHRGWTLVPETQERRWPFVLPLDSGDLVVGGMLVDGGVVLATAFGLSFRVHEGVVTPCERVVPEAPVLELASPVGPLSVIGTARVGGHDLGWNDDGWLWAVPQASGAEAPTGSS